MLRSEDAAIHYEAVRFTVNHFLKERYLNYENWGVYTCSLLIFVNLLGWCYWESGPFVPKHKERSTPCRSFATNNWIIEVGFGCRSPSSLK